MRDPFSLEKVNIPPKTERRINIESPGGLEMVCVFNFFSQKLPENQKDPQCKDTYGSRKNRHRKKYIFPEISGGFHDERLHARIQCLILKVFYLKA